MDANDMDSISIDGLGDVPSPSETRKARDGRKQAADVPVPGECPVTGCSADHFETFAELRGHFGKMSDGGHSAYDLSIDDYRRAGE